jgi:hypothetical protein
MVGQDGLRAYADVRYKVYGCAYVPTWVDECLRKRFMWVGVLVGRFVFVCLRMCVCCCVPCVCVANVLLMCC